MKSTNDDVMMQCPKCGISVLESDQFCEECGTSLTAIGCEKCGAKSEAIDNEGFCSVCGFRKEVQERLEITIDSHLAGVSDRGLRHHRNEDYLALQSVNNNTHILIVCDGVSSSSNPHIAAQTATESASTALITAIKQQENPQSAIKTAVAAALSSLCNIAYNKSINSEPPSTTIVAAVVQQNTATIGWLGDSRAYWISGNNSQQLTKDHSWVSEVVAAGEMTQAEARKSPQANAITRWLGADAIDDAIPTIINFTIPSSGYLLLCSDGLWNYAEQPQKLANLIQQTSNTDAIAISQSLVEFARHSGGHDNITVALLSL
ncbi:protein phosphatase 2C domain-containing protein [Plectonema radiosum NIES-515]|uniref:Protein phosphatase 2C domain-containing protein n=1 Tax=Plectonema radiosum NIES-515 TaxID=2986073 RepID=A0ABT3AYJ2_9CYAN|nr:protein phosphatase 2C domain-containing protein [Plectonema radiosum]MCV3214198.1 protein phosphatase 2C domain-containing protein [Plectonema radiosum NIES-515]